jgi:hypothetical protein
LIFDIQSLFKLNPEIDSPGKVFKNLYRLDYDNNNPEHKKLYAKLKTFFNDDCVCSTEHLENELHIKIAVLTSPYIRSLRNNNE